ncbi:uncharacterized protein FIBRA_02856 [Fibroporia radiculosa]|uniref:Uncharacterized protein n=1 Tax=Fibroporia radiculosa TaxID=599839 RepID=J4H231_9APHY|nr:uncharacterized protein FIBRA_02856 [Fibroporia radiculosa]CCM00814.1 predicted protein [Fibroporia radiculosa]
MRLPTFVSLFLLVISQTVLSSPCVSFDSSFNLLAFGLDGKDWNAGTQESWANGTAADITANGRPPFDGVNTTCYLAQFFNAVYVLNGNSSDSSAVHIYDAAGKSWSRQSVITGSFDATNFAAILDHDTNVFYALSQGSLFYLNMGSMTSANSTAISWIDADKSPYPSSYTSPVMALAQNHIHFLDVPGVPAGSADIFVIHYNYFQPASQPYPVAGGGTIPATQGKTASFFQAEGVQQEFAFIPEDGSATYVINVETNTTEAYTGPSTKDAAATYAASITALVQLDSKGNVMFFPYTEGDVSVNTAATWTKVAAIAAVAPATSSSASSSTTGTAGETQTIISGGGGPTTTGSASGHSSGSLAVRMSGPLAAAGLVGVLACVL